MEVRSDETFHLIENENSRSCMHLTINFNFYVDFVVRHMVGEECAHALQLERESNIFISIPRPHTSESTVWRTLIIIVDDGDLT